MPANCSARRVTRDERAQDRLAGRHAAAPAAPATQRPLLRQPDEGPDPVAGQLQLGLPRPGAGPPVPQHGQAGDQPGLRRIARRQPVRTRRQYRAARPRRAAQYLERADLPGPAAGHRQPHRGASAGAGRGPGALYRLRPGGGGLQRRRGFHGAGQLRAAGFSPAARRAAERPGLRQTEGGGGAGYHAGRGDQPRSRLRAELPPRPRIRLPAVLPEGSDQHARPSRRHHRRAYPVQWQGRRRGGRRFHDAATDQSHRVAAAPLPGIGAGASGAVVPGAADHARRPRHLRQRASVRAWTAVTSTATRAPASAG